MEYTTPDWDGLAEKAESAIGEQLKGIHKVREANARKVLAAFRKRRVSDTHFAASTGYAYNDLGRETLDGLFSDIFRTESALVRSQLVSGTHAIAAGLFGLLRPGDELLSLTGAPYDTLAKVIGIGQSVSGSLSDFGIRYRQLNLLPDGRVDYPRLKESITPATRVALIQRSRGYAWRPALRVSEIGDLIQQVKSIQPSTVCYVDNCYGEFVEVMEPSEVGADLIAGSLIKNPGGGLAPSGGYLAGRTEYVEAAAARLTAPGIGGEVGASPAGTRLLYQGLFLAPHAVGEALSSAVFTARLLSELGFAVSPEYDAVRSDTIQAIRLDSPERLIAFCQGLQMGSPVDSHVSPEPWDMPGYTDPIIMAAGTFVQGATLELSADAPLRPPYIIYMQGGLAREYSKIAVLTAVQEVVRRGLL